MLEDAMVVAPRHEASLFGNRDKFDLVVVYDGSSESFGAANTPLSILVRVISEKAFQKVLNRMPMMLVGGFEAWKREIGNTELRGESSYVEGKRPIPTTDVPDELPNFTLPSMPTGPSSNESSRLVPKDLWTGESSTSPLNPFKSFTVPIERPSSNPFNANGRLKAPRILSEYPVIYWPDMQVGTSGLKNLGNTSYMNAPIQCLSATVPFSRFFTGA